MRLFLRSGILGQSQVEGVLHLAVQADLDPCHCALEGTHTHAGTEDNDFGMDVFDFDPLAVSGPWQWNRGVRRSQRQAVDHDTPLYEFAKAYRDGNLVDRCQRIGVITPLPDSDIPRHQTQKRIDRQVAYADFQCGTT